MPSLGQRGGSLAWCKVLLTRPYVVVQSLHRRGVGFLHRQLAQVLDLGKSATQLLVVMRCEHLPVPRSSGAEMSGQSAPPPLSAPIATVIDIATFVTGTHTCLDCGQQHSG